MKEQENKPMSFPLTVIVSMLAVKLAEREFERFKDALRADGLDDKVNFVKFGNGDLCDKSKYLSKLPQMRHDLKLLSINFARYEQNAYHWDKHKREKCDEIDEIRRDIVEIADVLSPETEKMFCALKNIFDDEGCVFTHSISRCCNMLSLLRLNKSSIESFQKHGNPTFRQEGTLRLLSSQQLNTYADRIREMIFTPEDVDVMDSQQTQNCIATFSRAMMAQYKKYFLVKDNETETQNENI